MGTKQIITAGGSIVEPFTAQEEIDHAQMSDAEHLEEMKKAYRTKIDTAAESARLRHITNGAGQAMTYQLKGAEADAYILAGYPADLTGYPFVQAEINATGKTKEDAADDIVTQRNAWVVLGATIEETRIGGKTAVNAAIDANGVETAATPVLTALGAM